MVIYWHRADFSDGFPAIADEWRDEDHLQFALYWLDLPGPGEQVSGRIVDDDAPAPADTDGILAMLHNALSAAYDDGFEGNEFNAGEAACALIDAFDPAMRTAQEPTLEWLARTMANHYPMLAIVRALDKAAPGIRGAFSPPRAVGTVDDGA